MWKVSVLLAAPLPLMSLQWEAIVLQAQQQAHYLISARTRNQRRGVVGCGGRGDSRSNLCLFGIVFLHAWHRSWPKLITRELSGNSRSRVSSETCDSGVFAGNVPLGRPRGGGSFWGCFMGILRSLSISAPAGSALSRACSRPASRCTSASCPSGVVSASPLSRSCPAARCPSPSSPIGMLPASSLSVSGIADSELYCTHVECVSFFFFKPARRRSKLMYAMSLWMKSFAVPSRMT
jgi:hypothetical protein